MDAVSGVGTRIAKQLREIAIDEFCKKMRAEMRATGDPADLVEFQQDLRSLTEFSESCLERYAVLRFEVAAVAEIVCLDSAAQRFAMCLSDFAAVSRSLKLISMINVQRGDEGIDLKIHFWSRTVVKFVGGEDGSA